MTASIYIAFAVLGILALFLIVRAIKRSVELRRYRRRNREHQFSGSADTEGGSYWGESGYAEVIGRRGERRVASYLEDLPCEEYRIYNDILIRNGRHTTQVDHLIISPYGVFVIETKNVHGKVYGSGNAEFWKQYLPDIGYRRYGFTQEHQLRNPLWQNAGHVKTLRRLVFGNDVPVQGIVAFPAETDVYVTADQPVLKFWDVVPYILEYREEVLTLEQMDDYQERLLGFITTSAAAREEHLDNVYGSKERRDRAVASGICPFCGGNLVLREGRYGRFYGCSNYPKCNYTLNT
jgi:hypothetical protein